jgi:hypothetical protein
MRADMPKVIVDRPRRVGKPPRKGRVKAFDDLPAREGIRAHIDSYNGGKEVHDHLAPLRRYLDRQVGRPWDKVFSEIVRDGRMGEVLRHHVVEHVRAYVAIEEPALMARAGPEVKFRPYGDRPWPERFYVDPRNGLLKRTDDSPEAKALRRKAKGS